MGWLKGKNQTSFKAAGRTWRIAKICPADMLSIDFWPFSAYSLKEKAKPAVVDPAAGNAPKLEDAEYFKQDLASRMFGHADNKAEIPENLKTAASKIEVAKKAVIMRAVISPKIIALPTSNKKLISYAAIEKDKTLFDRIYAEIFKLSYGFTNRELLLGQATKTFSKDFIIQIYMQAKRFKIEPWELFQGGGLPALKNPKRWDFNLLVFATGAEFEKQNIETMNENAKKQVR